MAALHNLAPEPVFRKPGRQPGYLAEPELIREQRREAREQLLQQQEDYDYRAPVADGSAWIGAHE